MRSFYHADITLPAHPLQQCVQLCQSLTADGRRIRGMHESANGCIEHPLRNGQRPCGRPFFLESTVKDWLAALSYRCVNRDGAIKPRMPRISKNTQLGNVGLVLFGSTTANAITVELEALHPAKPAGR
jgi:hypothetical protein